ncbi:hypothetical protein EBL89_05280 [Cereibacter sphaeroides]|uniref:hypothetical protein n=1 Tax=Cereibacter sphaeroides TaxID=1063 RepID=UPI000F5402F7|nr:hypothetical protein [Cereibacter sphaeroides]AZB54757.1 hypothetical protein EBL89_05280 [Cereibacter sphaeroides]AZB59023.1 hypothetical protein EBL88_05315 [Cereibacter sphaeroides]
MEPRDYASTPVADSLGLHGMISGLAEDLRDMRAGKISPADGLARAAVAKQIFNRVRLYLTAVKTLEAPARGRQEPQVIEGHANG